MDKKILQFSGTNHHQGDRVSNTLTKTFPKRAADIVSIGNRYGVYRDRLPNDVRVQDFFEVLAKSRILYIVQQKDGPLLGSDTVYVHTFENDGESKKVEMTITEFYAYTADNPDIHEGYGNFMTGYATRLRYMIESGDEDADDFENMEQLRLSEAVDFEPEKTPIINADKENGYEYSIIDVMGELHIPSRNFKISDKYCPPLLYLLIDAAYHFGILAQEENSIHIAKYGEGQTKSLTLSTTYRELLEYIDASILRGYPLLPKKYDTPEKRRKYIRDTLVVKCLDPDLIGIGYVIAPDNEDEEE